MRWKTIKGGKKIKLIRWGFSKQPFYIMSVQWTRHGPRSGDRFEDVGWWDPSPAGDGNMHLGLKMDRIKFWLANHTTPTPKVADLLARAGMIPEVPKPPQYSPEDPLRDTKWRPDLLKKQK